MGERLDRTQEVAGSSPASSIEKGPHAGPSWRRIATRCRGASMHLRAADNVIRADLSPIEGARWYRRLVDKHDGSAKVASLVGKSERLIAERLDLLRLPNAPQELLAARRLPLACALLVRMTERAAPRRTHGCLAWSGVAAARTRRRRFSEPRVSRPAGSSASAPSGRPSCRELTPAYPRCGSGCHPTRAR
jgi:hypothetical protein